MHFGSGVCLLVWKRAMAARGSGVCITKHVLLEGRISHLDAQKTRATGSWQKIYIRSTRSHREVV